VDFYRNSKAGFPLVESEQRERIEKDKIIHFGFLLILLRHRKMPPFWDVVSGIP
jgi:hypothetical protein